MTQTSYTSASGAPAAKPGTVLGVPLGDMGWFASLLMGLATGFAAFFASTFCGIFGIMILNGIRNTPIDYADAYLVVGFPIGVVVMALALGFLGVMWVKRMLRKA